MLNRKGHVGTILMVLGAIVLVVTTLFSFSIFSEITGGEKIKLNYFISEFSFEQKYSSIVLKDMVREAILEAKEKENFEKEFENELKKIAERRRSPEISNLFGKIINEPFELTKLNNNYIWTMDEVFINVEQDKSYIERKFNFKIEFNKSQTISQGL